MSHSNDSTAAKRIREVLDKDSFVELGAYVTARSTDFNLADRDTPADGVVTGYGTIEDKLVFIYSQDPAVLGGSVGEMHAKKISNLYDQALKMGAPVIGLIDCSGLLGRTECCRRTVSLPGRGKRRGSADPGSVWGLRRKYGGECCDRRLHLH